MENLVTITGMGHMQPPHRIDNAFFETLDIETSAQWIEERTGIRSRYSVLEPRVLRALRFDQKSYLDFQRAGQIPSLASMAPQPWQQTLKRAQHAAGFQPDLLVCGTSVPDYDIPANACLIAKQLGIDAATFDANSACSSFVTDLQIAGALLKQGTYKDAAVFNCERYSTRLNYLDRSSAILFGDGAGCALLQAHAPGSSLKGLRLLDTLVRSDPSGAGLVEIPSAGLFSQEGSRVQKFAISKTCQISQEILERNRINIQDIHYFIGHQANLRMLQSVVQKLGLREGQHLFNVDRCGNQGAAGAPSVLSEHWEKFRPGELIVVAVVGAGLTWGAALLQKT